MIKRWIRLGAVLSFALPASADVHLVVRARHEAYYNFGVTTRAVEKRTEYWIGEDRLVVLTGSRRQVLGPDRNRLWLIDDTDKIAAAIPIPFDAARSADPDLLDYFRMDSAGGTIVPAGEERTTGEGRRREYRLEFWSGVDGSRSEEWTGLVDVALDPPIPAIYLLWRGAVCDIRRSIAHWDGALTGSIKALPGFPVRGDFRIHIKGRAHGVSEAVDISEGPPPAGIFQVPDDYRAPDILDLRLFNAFAAPGEWGIILP